MYKRRTTRVKINLKHELSEGKILPQVLSHKNKTMEWLTNENFTELSATQMYNFEVAEQLLMSHQNSVIAIIIDNDADGITSAAECYLWLKENFPSAQLRILIGEGKTHGIFEKVFEQLEGVNLLIIPDAGSSELENFRKIKELGIDILVLDHHEMPEEDNPYATIVNPWNVKCPYLNKNLSGSAVVLKFFQAIDKKLGKQTHLQFVDLAAIGLVGDMMDLSSMENRGITNYGLTHIENPFLKELIKAHPKLQDLSVITPFAVSFYIAPVINAVIRIGTIEDKLDMFSAVIGESNAQAVIAKMLKLKGSQDRKKEPMVVRIAYNLSKTGSDQLPIILAESPAGMPKSMTGLIAGQLTSMYGRPSILGRVENGKFIGSGRSIQGSSVENLKDFCNDSGLFDWANGHASAFGCQFPIENMEAFLAHAKQNLPIFEMIHNVDYSLAGVTAKDDIVMELAELEQYFCKGFEQILIHDQFFIDPQDIKIVGKNFDTVIINHGSMKYIAFKQKGFELPTSRKFITIIGKASQNEWLGDITPQIIIEDFLIEDGLL